mmetsp:Transcript_56259/g.155221  ORF Transcript_56259/g.155221 Transcript_56259/m.155221 type:complete len:330 (-) Transcript_56259:880-1869(-)
MAEGHGLAAHEVIQPVRVVRVEEAIAHPLAGLDLVVELVHKLERALDALLGRERVVLDGAGHGSSVVLKDVARLLAHQQAELARLVPVHVGGHDINLADEDTFRPVEKHHAVRPLDGQHLTTEEALGARKGRLDSLVLLEVFECLHARDRLADGVVACAKARPAEVESRAELLVTKRLARVDDVLTITTHHDETAVAVVLDRLRVNLSGAKILHSQRKALAVRNILSHNLLGDTLKGGGDDLVVERVDQLARVVIHARHRHLVAQLEHNGALIVPDRQLVRVARACERPGALHAIVEGGLRAVSGGVPDSHGAILGARDEDRQPRVEHD